MNLSIQPIKSFIFVLFLSCLVASQAIAADKIGAIAAVIGTVSIEREGKIVKVLSLIHI